MKYATAVYSYTPPPAASSGVNNADASRDPQAVQAALSQLIQEIRQKMESRLASSNALVGGLSSVKSNRWFLQIRSLRLAIPGESQSSSARTMYMTRNASQPDSLTLVIEDPAHAAVNISSLATSSFDYYMSRDLLLPLGSKDPSGVGGPSNPAAVGQQVDPREQLQRNQSSRWIPRPSFAQIEGVTIQDPIADFQISVGMISGRGGTAGSSGIVANDLVIQLEYLPIKFFDSQVSSGTLEDYLSSLLPKYSSIRDVSAETTFLDWKSLLSIRAEEAKVPAWSARNTSWCLVKLCKEGKML